MNIHKSQLLFAVVFYSMVSMQVSQADINDCGGVGQPTCRYSTATFISKVRNPKPIDAFIDPRNDGEYWRCPIDFPRRTAYPVTDMRACATKKLIGEKLSPAEFLGKVIIPKPAGAFIDPRNGGEYWQCPSGFARNITPVNSSNACIVLKASACNNNLIAFTVPSGNEICVKKNECGQNNQRFCLLAEYITSCKQGFVQDPRIKDSRFVNINMGGYKEVLKSYSLCRSTQTVNCMETILRSNITSSPIYITWPPEEAELATRNDMMATKCGAGQMQDNAYQ